MRLELTEVVVLSRQVVDLCLETPDLVVHALGLGLGVRTRFGGAIEL